MGLAVLTAKTLSDCSVRPSPLAKVGDSLQKTSGSVSVPSVLCIFVSLVPSRMHDMQ